MFAEDGKILLDTSAVILLLITVLGVAFKDYWIKLKNSPTLQQFLALREELMLRADKNEEHIEKLHEKIDKNFEIVNKNLFDLAKVIKN